MPRSQYLFSLASIATSAALLGAFMARIATQIDLQWWAIPAFLAGMAAADFLSGLIHWAADTWGRDDYPIVGPRLLRPFRLHHIDPDDLRRRPFVDANGDVAFVTVPVLAMLLLLPLESSWAAPLAIGGLGLCAIGMWTNQIHQWAHMPAPPALIRVLQDCRLILGRTAHAAHHAGAYDAHYCITTGWWNGPLEHIGFFRRAEHAITRITGMLPREDERVC